MGDRSYDFLQSLCACSWTPQPLPEICRHSGLSEADGREIVGDLESRGYVHRLRPISEAGDLNVHITPLGVEYVLRHEV